MKKHIACFALLVLLCSCKGGNTDEVASDTCDTTYTTGHNLVLGERFDLPTMDTKKYRAVRAHPCVYVRYEVEVPTGTDKVASSIREVLLASLKEYCEHSSYCGTTRNVQDFVSGHAKSTYDNIFANIMEYLHYDGKSREMIEHPERYKIPDEKDKDFDFDRQMTDAYSITKSAEAYGFVVFEVNWRGYEGGVHGYSNTYYLTFDKRSGALVDAFLSDDATEALQPFVIKGLQQYYAGIGKFYSIEDISRIGTFMSDDGLIPLPESCPGPNATGDSLIFVYREYEIGCYADGMHTYTIALSDLWPYLTPEAARLWIAQED